jgi:Na+(H+)/acetate symporter ActP
VQYWVKLVAVVVPALALIMIWRPHDEPHVHEGPPRFLHDRTVSVEHDLTVHVPESLPADVRGRLDGRHHGGERLTIGAGRHTLQGGSSVRFTAGTVVPHVERLPVQDRPTWATPLGGHPGRLLGTYSLILCCALGTMGLPYILMRFYTSASGRDARRTAAMVTVMLALFAFFPAVYGVLGRVHTPELLMTGDTDATVLTLPGRLVPGTGGALLTGLLVAGAFAAFVSASCGGVVGIASTLAQCAVRGRTAGFRLGAAAALAVPLALMAGPLGQLSAGRLIIMGFGVSACSLCPLLVLGIWWRGLTAAGACAGLVTGTGLVLGAGAVLLPDGPVRSWPDPLATWPVLAVFPVTVAVMVVVSLLTRERAPRHADRAMARMHVPEGV